MSASPMPSRSAFLSTDVFPDATYVIRRPFWSFLGRTVRVYDAGGQLVMFVRVPLLRIYQGIKFWADEAQTRLLATVTPRKELSLRIHHDVLDAEGAPLGALRGRGLKSLMRDTWDILDADGQEAGVVQEEGHAFLRRLLPILPGRWRIDFEGRTAGRIRQVFRFFVKEYRLNLDASQTRLDTRLAVACALLALLAESRRES